VNWKAEKEQLKCSPMRTSIAIFLLVFALTATAATQNTSTQKPYDQMTLDEVTRILFNSPWAQYHDKFTPNTQSRPETRNYPPGTNSFVHMRLYSALPIRQAIVRRMQLTIPYAQLAPAQRASYDEEVDGLLKCQYCAEYYIISLTSAREDNLTMATRGDAVTIDAVAIMKRLPEAELLQHVSLLNDKGVRRNAERVLFTKKNEVVFLFRRFDDQGKALINAGDKKFYVDFDEFLTKKSEEALKKFTFDVKKLVQGGAVIF